MLTLNHEYEVEDAMMFAPASREEQLRIPSTLKRLQSEVYGTVPRLQADLKRFAWKDRWSHTDGGRLMFSLLHKHYPAMMTE